MNKNQKITLTIAALTVIIVALVASTYYLSGAQTQNVFLPSGEPPSGQLKVTGDVASEKTLTVKELSKMPLTKVTTTIKGETATYIGVSMLELLNRTGASWDTGFINVIASDGFNKTINTYQAFNSTQYSGIEIILAFAKNGKWITDSNEGPLKLITPSLASAFNVKSVNEIKLQPWVIKVSGAISNPLTITGANITSFEVKTVNAAFAPGGEPQRTSDWTGATLWSVLQSSGLNSGATKITVTAVDGYSKDFTITQVQDNGMLIGYKENSDYLSYAGGQPFRLMIPTTDFKWGQYWVRWVTQITVS